MGVQVYHDTPIIEWNRLVSIERTPSVSFFTTENNIMSFFQSRRSLTSLDLFSETSPSGTAKAMGLPSLPWKYLHIFLRSSHLSVSPFKTDIPQSIPLERGRHKGENLSDKGTTIKFTWMLSLI